LRNTAGSIPKPEESTDNRGAAPISAGGQVPLTPIQSTSAVPFLPERFWGGARQKKLEEVQHYPVLHLLLSALLLFKCKGIEVGVVQSESDHHLFAYKFFKRFFKYSRAVCTVPK